MGNEPKFYLYDGEGYVQLLAELSVVKLTALQVSHVVYVCETPGGKLYVSCPTPAKAVVSQPDHSELDLEIRWIVRTDLEEAVGSWCWRRLHSTRALVIWSNEVIH